MCLLLHSPVHISYLTLINHSILYFTKCMSFEITKTNPKEQFNDFKIHTKNMAVSLWRVFSCFGELVHCLFGRDYSDKCITNLLTGKYQNRFCAHSMYGSFLCACVHICNISSLKVQNFCTRDVALRMEPAAQLPDKPSIHSIVQVRLQLECAEWFVAIVCEVTIMNVRSLAQVFVLFVSCLCGLRLRGLI